MDIRGHFEGVTGEVSYKEFPEARGAVKVLSSEPNRLGHAEAAERTQDTFSLWMSQDRGRV